MRQEQYHTRETINGQEVDVSNVGNTPGVKYLRSYICEECGLAFKEDRVTWFRGKVYGIPCGCHRDIPSLLAKERSERITSVYNRQKNTVGE